jgi:dolichol-phosphate mannosyltransferase
MEPSRRERYSIVDRYPGRRIAVVVPAYRAAQSIADVIRSMPAYVADIVVVDDCSPDDTAACASAAGDSRVRVVRHTANRGVGGATWTGITEAVARGAEVVVKMDADGQMDPAHLPRLLAPVLEGTADYAKGNRFIHRRQLGAMPLLRRLGNTGLSFLTKAASGYWNVFDPTNGYLVVGAHVLDYVDPAEVDQRYFFEISMLLELSLARAVVVDVDVPARYRDEVSGLSEWSSLRTFPQRLLRALLKRVYVLHFVRDFGLTAVFLTGGALLSGFGIAFGTWSWWQSAQADSVTPAGTVMISALSLIVGVQCLLQAILLDVQSQPTKPLARLAQDP